LRSVPGTNASEMRSFANPFLQRSSRPFVSSGCLPPGYLRARETAERQGDISDYPPKHVGFRGTEDGHVNLA
jgi:hypothetical protein